MKARIKRSFPPPPPPRSRWRARLVALAVVALLGATISAVGAVTLTVRIDEGRWRVPAKADFVRIARRFDPKL